MFDFISEIGKQFLGPLLEPAFELLGFTDQTIYQWAIKTVRMVPDESLPEQSQLVNNILSSTFNNTNISDNVLLTALSGAKASLGQYLRYGENTYTLGNPTLQFKTPPIHTARFLEIVAAELITKNFTVVAGWENTEIREPTRYEWGLAYLIQNEGYTNHITDNSIDYTYYQTTITGTDYKAECRHYTNETTYTTLIIDLPDYGDSEYQIYYVYSAAVTDASGTTFGYKYLFPFNYSGASGEYPTMIYSGSGNYEQEDATRILPIIVLRQHGEFINENDHPTQYATTKTLLRKLNMDMDNIIQAIEEDEEGTPNPDLDALQDAFIICSLSLYTNSDAGKYYLYLFFKLMYEAIAVGSYTLFTNTDIQDVTKHIIHISEDTYNIGLLFNYIRQQIIEENIGEINTVIRVFDIKPNIHVTVGETTKEYNVSTVTFKRQITSTHCEYITVHGLQFFTHLTHGDGTEKGYVQDMVEEGSEGNNYFHIPLSYVLLQIYGFIDVETLIYESLTLVVYAAASEDLEYYETENFAQFINGVMTFIAIVATMYGASTAVELIRQILIQYILAKIFQAMLLEMAITTEQKIVVAVVWAYVSLKMGNEWGEISLTATNVLAAITSLSDSYTYNAQDELRQLKEEYDQTQEEAQETLKDLEATWNSLEEEKNMNIDPLMFTKSTVIDNDDATTYYARTLCTNTSKIAINYINHYTQNKLDVTFI